MNTTLYNIEERARRIARASTQELWQASALGHVAREIQLTLQQLTEVRELHKHIRTQLDKEECRVRTDLLQPQPSAERSRLKSQLAGIESERRRNQITKHEQEKQLHINLLSLINKHTHLTLDDED